MPYVQRDFCGNIKGIYANAQLGYAEEFLPNENEEIAAYLKKHPAPKIRPLTKEQIKKLHLESEALDKEEAVLRNAILAHLIHWSELENALSALLYVILRIEPASSKIAYTIYFSLPGFDTRRLMIGRVIEQFILENPRLKDFLSFWKPINEALSKARNIRNVVAHGSPLRISHHRKTHVVFTAPAFDVYRVGNLVKKGSTPGLTSSMLFKEVEKIGLLIECIDAVNKALTTFRDFGEATLTKTIPEIEESLKKFKISR